MAVMQNNRKFPKVLKVSKATLEAAGFAPGDPDGVQGLELVTLLTRV